jgi:hypothetical protein
MSWQSGDPEAPPKVYLPRADGEAPPAYETYADPAEAHGWREGQEDGGAGAGETYGDGDDTLVQRAVPDAPPGRHERLLRRRRARLVRRAAVGAGVGCAVLLAVVVSGVFDSGASTGPRTSGGGRGDSAREDASSTPSAPSAPSATATGGGTEGPSPDASRSSASPSTVSSATAVSASASPSPSVSAAPASTASATVSATGTADSGPGNSGGSPGHGQGATKRPK